MCAAARFFVSALITIMKNKDAVKKAVKETISMGMKSVNVMTMTHNLYVPQMKNATFLWMSTRWRDLPCITQIVMVLSLVIKQRHRTLLSMYAFNVNLG